MNKSYLSILLLLIICSFSNGQKIVDFNEDQINELKTYLHYALGKDNGTSNEDNYNNNVNNVILNYLESDLASNNNVEQYITKLPTLTGDLMNELKELQQYKNSIKQNLNNIEQAYQQMNFPSQYFLDYAMYQLGSLPGQQQFQQQLSQFNTEFQKLFDSLQKYAEQDSEGSFLADNDIKFREDASNGVTNLQVQFENGDTEDAPKNVQKVYQQLIALLKKNSMLIDNTDGIHTEQLNKNQVQIDSDQQQVIAWIKQTDQKHCVNENHQTGGETPGLLNACFTTCNWGNGRCNCNTVCEGRR